MTKNTIDIKNKTKLSLSVIIPALNESKSGIFERVLEPFEGLNNVELIVCDGGSSDNTVAVARKAGAKIVQGNFPSRAQRINEGVKASSGELVLINHPRSIVEVLGIAYIIANRNKFTWGGFTHAFDERHPLLKFTSWYSNKVRATRGGIVYLDHCKFARREVLVKALPLPHVEIFEDTLLSKKLLLQEGKPEILPFLSTTSSIRFKTNGYLKQALINQWLKLCFHLGKDHKKMNAFYEKSLDFNTDKSKRS